VAAVPSSRLKPLLQVCIGQTHRISVIEVLK